MPKVAESYIEVSSDAVAAYVQAIKRAAEPLQGWGGAELDDLVQEGLISIWHALAKGVKPSVGIAQKRMLSYIKWLRKQNSVKQKDGTYEEILPLDPNLFPFIEYELGRDNDPSW